MTPTTPERELVARIAAKLREALDVCIDDGDGAIDVNGLANVIYHDTIESLLADKARLVEALEFYADPGSWYGAYVVGSSSPMADDWSDDCADGNFPDGKPGKRARTALNRSTDHAG
jgi:hypothetical protein